MILLIDAGNSRIKWATCVDKQWLEQGVIPYQQHALSHLLPFLRQYPPQRIIIVHVLGETFATGIKNYAKVQAIPLLMVHSHSHAYGITTHYRHPQRLGTDRLVAMAAAYHFNQQSACIVVDCGTAVTIDAINHKGEHLGGMIYPGLHLCKDSLTQRAHNLKTVPTDNNHRMHPCAKDTPQAIQSGCYYGLAAAIEGMCQRMEQQLSDNVNKILCGGDARLIYDVLPQQNYQLEPDLVIQGLHLIATGSLTHNQGECQ